MHDTGLIKQGLAALRHHNAKRKKIKAKTVVKRRSLQSCIIVQHKNHIILMRTAARRAGHIFFFVLANVSSSMLYLFTGVAQFLALYIFLYDECILFEKFA